MIPSRPLQVLLIGCGNIAGGFDDAGGAGDWPLTHAGAYSRSRNFRIAACVEPDPVRLRAFMTRWQVPVGFEDIEKVTGDGRFDVISICSPTGLHALHLEHALRLRPQAVFCEKPVTPDAAATRDLVKQFEQAGIALAVNHTRRWAPDVVQLRDQLAREHYGRVRSIIGHYNKGILNNGSHMLDLIAFLFGPLQLLWAGPAVNDYWVDDPTMPAVLTTTSGITVYLNPLHAQDYARFELEIATSKGLLAMEGGGQAWRWRGVEPSSRFKGYQILGDARNTAGEYAQAMTLAVANLYEALRHGAPLASNGHTASEAQMLCEKIRNMANEHSATALGGVTHSGAVL